jgi:chromatin remodeling complex protein RSC6
LDPHDSEYVVVDERLKPLLDDLEVTRVNLVELAKLVTRYIVTDDSHDVREGPVVSQFLQVHTHTVEHTHTNTHTHTHTRVCVSVCVCINV